MNFLYKTFRAIFCALSCTSVLLLCSTPLGAQNSIPNLGDDGAMSLGQERHLGDQIGKEIYRDPQYVSDPVLDAYVQELWQRLYAQAKRSGALPPEMDEQFAWRLFLVRDKSVNAFALPGGYMGIHLGLIAQSDSPDALASVLAHETTHITQRHIARGMSKQNAQTPWIAAAMLGALLAMRTNPQVATAALHTAPALGIQAQLNFSRDFEREADRLGFALMAPSGYNPEGFVQMFTMLGKASRLSDSGNFPYLRTHPLTTERMADMRVRVGEFEATNPLAKASANPDALLLHRMMAARSAVLADLSVDALKFFMQQGDAALQAAPPYSLVTLYAAALASAQAKDDVRARRFYEQLKGSTSIRTPAPVLTAIRWLAADLQLPGLLVALDLSSPLRVEMLYAARQLLNKASATTQERQALSRRLQDWTSQYPNDIDAWSFLAQAYMQQGLRVRASMATAEGLRAQLDDAAALTQYQVTQDMMRQHEPVDNIDAAIVDSKVRQLQERLNETKRKATR